MDDTWLAQTATQVRLTCKSLMWPWTAPLPPPSPSISTQQDLCSCSFTCRTVVPHPNRVEVLPTELFSPTQPCAGSSSPIPPAGTHGGTHNRQLQGSGGALAVLALFPKTPRFLKPLTRKHGDFFLPWLPTVSTPTGRDSLLIGCLESGISSLTASYAPLSLNLHCSLPDITRGQNQKLLLSCDFQARPCLPTAEPARTEERGTWKGFSCDSDPRAH